VVNEQGSRSGQSLFRRSLLLSAVLVAAFVAAGVMVQGNAGVAYGEELDDAPLSWEAALDHVEPAESYEPIRNYLEDFPWTWQERVAQAAGLLRHTYPNDYSWVAFVPDGPGARIGFAGAVPTGAAKIIDTLRSYGEDIEVFDDQKLNEREILAATFYLTATAQEASAAPRTVEMQFGNSPVMLVSGATPEAEAVSRSLAEQLAVVADKTGAPTLAEIPIEFDAPASFESTDPAYDGMVVGPQAYGSAGRSAF
jgi:hypothetical protein